VIGYWHIDFGSAWRGIRAFRWPHGKVKYGIRFHKRPGLGLVLWTPIWHEGRGPYVVAGIGFVFLHRGY